MGLTDIDYYIYKIDKQEGPTVQHTGNYTQYLVITYNRKGVFYIYIYSDIYVYIYTHTYIYTVFCIPESL